MADPGPETSNPEAQEPTDPGQTGQTASATGALPEPTVVEGGQTRVTVTTSSAGSAVQIDGGTDLASYAHVSYWMTVSAPSVTGEFTVNPAPGAAFQYELMGTSNGIWGGRLLRVQRVPGSEELQGISTSGAVTCGPLPSGQPTVVTLSFDGVAHTFDVLIAGAPSACTDLPTKFGGNVTGVRVEDAGNLGYGGHVELTDLALF